MAATDVFQGILRNIENSNLNYSLSKTPYSASISLKSSFLKRYQVISKDNDLAVLENMPRKSTDDYDGGANTKVGAENLELRKEIERFKDATIMIGMIY